MYDRVRYLFKRNRGWCYWESLATFPVKFQVPWKMAHERERVSDQSAAEKSLSLIVNNFCKAKPLLKDVH